MQSGFRTSQYEEPLVQIRMVREPVTAMSETRRADRPDSTLVDGARPPLALRGKPEGRAPRRPGRDAPGDARRWSPSDDEKVVHCSIKPDTAGREVVRADRLCVAPKSQALGNPPVCGVEAPLGAVPTAAQALAGTPGSTA